jgi:AraC family transcriptional regulator
VRPICIVVPHLVIDELNGVIDGEESLVPEQTVPELTVEDVPARTYVIARERVRTEELTRVIPRLIGETHAWVVDHGGATGAPMAVVGPPDDEGMVGLEVGWPVEGLPEPPAPLETVTYEATRAVVHRHVGPYERLHETYGRLEHAIAAARLMPTGAARESYETNPEEEPDPEKWITEIVWPVA